jgi:hypothetical protein
MQLTLISQKYTISCYMYFFPAEWQYSVLLCHNASPECCCRLCDCLFHFQGLILLTNCPTLVAAPVRCVLFSPSSHSFLFYEFQNKTSPKMPQAHFCLSRRLILKMFLLPFPTHKISTSLNITINECDFLYITDYTLDNFK